MSHPELAIAGFYDHEQQTERSAPDWGGDDLFMAATPGRRFERAEPPPQLRGTDEHPVRPDDAETAPATPEDRYLEPVPDGRRTVTITGRPESFAVTRRAPRTIDERIAHRPERIASWTCAMGFLLILLAVLTSH